MSLKSKPVSDTILISEAAGFQGFCPHILPFMRPRMRTSCLVKDCHLHYSSMTSVMREFPGVLGSLAEQNSAHRLLHLSLL